MAKDTLISVPIVSGFSFDAYFRLCEPKREAFAVIETADRLSLMILRPDSKVREFYFRRLSSLVSTWRVFSLVSRFYHLQRT